MRDSPGPEIDGEMRFTSLFNEDDKIEISVLNGYLYSFDLKVERWGELQIEILLKISPSVLRPFFIPE